MPLMTGAPGYRVPVMKRSIGRFPGNGGFTSLNASTLSFRVLGPTRAGQSLFGQAFGVSFAFSNRP